MNQPPDDFLAPCPKLSWRMRVLQIGALLAAIGISLCFFALAMFVIGDSYTGLGSLPRVVMFLLWPTIWQIIVLLPCWRTWMLRRWACVLTAMVFVMAPPFLLATMLIPAQVPPLCFAIAIFMFVSAAMEWPNLKSGF